mgnify:CR=1 FL=1
MGYKKPENRSIQHHLSTPSTVAQMQRNGWRIAARCTTCQLDVWVSLSAVMKLGRPDLVLFGKSAACRRLHCTGRMIFLGVPPGQTAYFVLRAIEGR